MSVPADSGFRAVAWSMAVGVTLLLLVMVGRVAQLQLAPGESLSDHMSGRKSKRAELPVRGDLLDRRGRVVASTRFGERVLVDPTLLKQETLDRDINSLAKAMNTSAEKLGERIVSALDLNRKRAQNSTTQPVAIVVDTNATGEANPDAPKGPIRYLPVSEVLLAEQAQAVRELKIAGVWLEKREVREYVGGSEAASIAGAVGFEQKGMMGAEYMLDSELKGQQGAIIFVRDAWGQPLWIEPGGVRPATAGSDTRLSIDLELQRICHEELTKGVEEQFAAGGRLVLIDPATGEVLAMCDIIANVPDAVEYPWVDAPKPRKKGDPPAPREPDVLKTPRRYITIKADIGRKVHPALGRNRCVEDIYEPGSTFKPFVWATITDLGLARPAEIFDTEGGRWRTSYGRYIEDVTKRDRMSWQEVLVNSSNIGMIKGAERLTWGQLHDSVVRFGFGRKTGVGVPGKAIPGEAAGIVTPIGKWTKYTQTSVAYGHEISVTPVQMARAFSAFARNGEMSGTLPRLRLTAGDEDTQGVIYRVLPPDVATLTRVTMTGVIDTLDTKIKDTPEGGWRYRLFGKSGTAEIPLGKAPAGKKAPKGSTGYYDNQFNSSFIAGGPLEMPRLVCIVVIDDPGPRPGPRNLRYGTAAAGPVVRRVMERALTYLGVPQTAPDAIKPEIAHANPKP